MTLEQAYQLAGIIAALGMIGTLMYLAIQVRQNTIAVRTNTAQSLTDGLCSFFKYAAQSDTADIIFRGFQKLENLRDADRMRFFGIMHNNFFAYQNAYFQMKSGALEERLWNGALAHFKHTAKFPGARSYWSHRSYMYIDEFRRFVDAEVVGQHPNNHFNLAGMDFKQSEASS